MPIREKKSYSSNLGGPSLKEGVPAATKRPMNDTHRGEGRGGADIKIRIFVYTPSIVYIK
jgi:hypothetical protein